MKLGSKALRHSDPQEVDIQQIARNPIVFVLDRIIDTYNIGSLFRLADAVAAQKVYLCGNMEFPPSSRIHKAAVGTENWTPWEKRDTTLEVTEELKAKGFQIIAVEQSADSISYKDLKPNFPCAIVVGSETGGMDKEVTNNADIIVELPMFGVNNSFNVWGTAAVVAYKTLESLSKL